MAKKSPRSAKSSSTGGSGKGTRVWFYLKPAVAARLQAIADAEHRERAQQIAHIIERFVAQTDSPETSSICRIEQFLAQLQGSRTQSD